MRGRFHPGLRPTYPARTRRTAPGPSSSRSILELRRLDRELTTPHRLAIFDGGQVWPSSDLAMEAVEWMELQAMKAGLAPRDDQEIDRILARRTAAIDAGKADNESFLALQSIVVDFQGLRDVSTVAARAAELGRDKGIRAALKEDSKRTTARGRCWPMSGARKGGWLLPTVGSPP